MLTRSQSWKEKENVRRAASFIQKKFRQYMCNCVNGQEVCFEGISCMICMDDDRSHCCVRLPCRHAFHSFCISKWLMYEKSCPICRVHSIDKKRRRIEAEFAIVKELLYIPVKTLLKFQSACPFEIYSENVNLIEQTIRFIPKGRRNFEFIDPSMLSFIENKLNLFLYLKEAIRKFNRRSALLIVQSRDKILEKIRAKFCLSFEFIDSANPWKELDYLSNMQGDQIRMLRHHIMKYWEIQKIFQRDHMYDSMNALPRILDSVNTRYRGISIELIPSDHEH